MWKSTQLMAEAIADGIAETGVSAQPIHIRTSHRSEIMTEVLEAKAVVIGSPTLNNGLFPSVADVLTYMKGLKPKHKIGAAFGSYGWSGEAVKLLNQELSSMEIERIDDGLNIHYVPGTDDLAVCRDYGRRIGSAVIESLD
jgi:flavorubredoxin